MHYRKCFNKIWDGKSLVFPDPGWFSFLESLWNRKNVVILASSLSALFNPTHCGSLSIETIYFTLSMNNEMPQSLLKTELLDTITWLKRVWTAFIFMEKLTKICKQILVISIQFPFLSYNLNDTTENKKNLIFLNE